MQPHLHHVVDQLINFFQLGNSINLAFSHPYPQGTLEYEAATIQVILVLKRINMWRRRRSGFLGGGRWAQELEYVLIMATVRGGCGKRMFSHATEILTLI